MDATTNTINYLDVKLIIKDNDIQFMMKIKHLKREYFKKYSSNIPRHIKTNIINYFLTGTGERYMNPTFGTLLRNQLFENTTQSNLEDIENLIRQGVYLYFPNVTPSRIEVESIPDSNTVTLSMSYSINNTNIDDELTINFEI